MRILSYSSTQSIFMAVIVGLSLSCQRELDLDFPEPAPKLVLEGWIENGSFAEVLLTKTAPYFSAIDSNNLPDFSERYAKVSVFSDTEEEILTLQRNVNYFPPFLYRTIQMKGTVGQSYQVEVIWYGDTITATTTIPDPVPLDSVWFAPDPGMTDKGKLWIRLTDDALRDNYYRVLYKRKGKDTRFVSTGVSTFNDALFNGESVDLGFMRGVNSMVEIEKEYYFEVGDTISVKFCAIDQRQFEFWNVYQSLVLASSNPLATSHSKLPSNIRGGLGIWSGYGATYYLVTAQ